MSKIESLERISITIDDINKYFEKLKEMNIKKIEDLNDTKFYAASMVIFSIINKTIDLADEMGAIKNLGFPAEYKEIFTSLKYAKIIDDKMENKLKELTILRNKFAHRYNVIDKEGIFRAIKDLEIVKDFIERVKQVVKKNEKA